MYLVNKYLWSTYYVPGTAQGAILTLPCNFSVDHYTNFLTSPHLLLIYVKEKRFINSSELEINESRCTVSRATVLW